VNRTLVTEAQAPRTATVLGQQTFTGWLFGRGRSRTAVSERPLKDYGVLPLDDTPYFASPIAAPWRSESLEPKPGIEPGSAAYQAAILPLNYKGSSSKTWSWNGDSNSDLSLTRRMLFPLSYSSPGGR
jgi:hypothetical protein